MAIDGKRLVSIFLVLFSALGSFSCGGSSGSGGGATAPEGTAIAVNFLGSLPVAVAEQIGTGAWASATLQGTGLNLTVPSGTTSYSLAFLCPDTGPVDNEVVIEATTQDATTYSPDPLFCPPNPVMTTSSGSVDASAIPGAVNVGIYGNRGFGTGSHGAIVAAFDTFFLTGANDIAAVAYDASNDVIAVKIVRNQTVPFNGLSIVFAPSDVTSVYPAAITGAPSGFTVASAVLAQYVTANGTSFVVSHQVPSTQYSAVASTETAAGDYYEFSGNATDLSTNQQVGSIEATSAAGTITLALPAPLTATPPDPAALPSFDISYSGFSGDEAVGDRVVLDWTDSSNIPDQIVVFATSSYLNGATTLTIPDLSGVTGFLPSASSGTTINWGVSQRGGTYQTFEATPSDGSWGFASVSGTFTEP